MRVFLRSRVLEVWAALVASYWIFGWLPHRQGIATMMAGMVFSTWLGLAIAWWRGAWVSLHDPQSTLGGRIMMVNLAGLATGVTGVFFWSLLFQYLQQPEWMRYHPFRGNFLWMIAISGISLLAVSFVEGNTVLPARGFGKLGSLVAGVMCVAIMVAYFTGGFNANG